MKIRYLTLLTTLAFLGFSISAFAGKYGPPYPTFDVAFDGELQGNGTLWQSSKKQKSLTYWESDHPKFSEGVINGTYFNEQFPLSLAIPPPPATCFDGDVDMNGVQFFRDRDDGAAILKISFPGHPKNGTGDFMYLLTLEGSFDEPGNWLPTVSTSLPGVSTSVSLEGWKLKLMNKRENNLYSEESCVGSGSFGSDTMIVVVKNN